MLCCTIIIYIYQGATYHIIIDYTYIFIYYTIFSDKHSPCQRSRVEAYRFGRMHALYVRRSGKYSLGRCAR